MVLIVKMELQNLIFVYWNYIFVTKLYLHCLADNRLMDDNPLPSQAIADMLNYQESSKAASMVVPSDRVFE